MRKLLLILFIISSFNSKGTIHQIQVWNGYYQFLPPNNITVQLGDTIQWIPLDPPTMTHTITSDNIPAGASASAARCSPSAGAPLGAAEDDDASSTTGFSFCF